ncbi:MAG TPA: response regulator [Anaerolineae bacterium]|nr:response regulator [Anaerolineae bacterium]
MKRVEILIADDNEQICEFLTENVLTPLGYHVRIAADGEAALQMAREDMPDLMITDHQMPKLTGVELILKLKDEMPLLPIILITGEGSEELAAAALRAGAVNYLIKPFDADELLAAVELALEEGSRRRARLEALVHARVNAHTAQSKVKELGILTPTGRGIPSDWILDEMLTKVVDAAVQLTKAEEGCLLLYDDQSGALFLRASVNFDQDFARAFHLASTDSLAGQVIKSGEVVVVDEPSPMKITKGYLVHALIYAPLKARDRIIGVLGVDNRQPGHGFHQEHVQVLLSMAELATLAIETANLYENSEAQRSRWEAILTQAQNGIVVVDETLRLLWVNPAASQALGIDEDAMGNTIMEITEDQQLLDLLRLRDDLPRWEEIELQDGKIYNIQRTPIDSIGQAIVMHDISHLKKIDRIKSEFVTTVSHDLRSPLAAILGYVELIEHAGSLDDQQREFVRRIHISVDQITNLITNLLDLERIEAGLDESKEPTSVRLLAEYALESVRSKAVSRGLTLEQDLQEDLPMVMADPLRLRQMIGNLLDNAIKYTEMGGKVRMECYTEGDQIILRVSDSGIGIVPSEQAMLFDKFYRGSNIPEAEPGTGLGLSIVKSIVDNHNGRIWVESKLGSGSTFIVVLPTTLPV